MKVRSEKLEARSTSDFSLPTYHFPLGAAGAAALVVLAAVVIVTWPLFLTPAAHVSGHWDSFFGIWRLAWIADAIRSGDLQLFNAPIFYPHPRTLAFSDAVLLPGLAFAPLRYVGLSPTLVYNVALMAGFVTSGVAMFMLVRSLVGRADAAAVAAVIYAAAPYRLDHLDHFEMQMAAGMPLVLWMWHRAIDRESARLAAVAVGGAVLQWLSCIYYGLLFAPVFAVMVAIELAGVVKAQRTRILDTLAASAVAGAIVIGAYSIPYVSNRGSTGDRDAEAVARYSATPESYLAVPPRNMLYGPWLSRFGDAETRLFPGAMALVLAVAGLAAGPWNRRRWAYVAGGLVAVDLSFGTNGFLFSVLRDWAVPYRGLRAPARAAIMALLVISVFAGSGAARLLARFPSRRAATMATAVIVLLLLVEYRTPADLWEAPSQTGRPELGVVRTAVVAEMPMAPPDRLDRSVDAYYMVTRVGEWPMLVNGYSGFYPADHLTFLDRTRQFPDERSIREMARVGVTVVAVHERWYGPRFPEIIAALDLRTDVEKIGEYNDRERPVALYQILKSEK